MNLLRFSSYAPVQRTAHAQVERNHNYQLKPRKDHYRHNESANTSSNFCEENHRQDHNSADRSPHRLILRCYLPFGRSFINLRQTNSKNLALCYKLCLSTLPILRQTQPSRNWKSSLLPALSSWVPSHLYGARDQHVTSFPQLETEPQYQDSFRIARTPREAKILEDWLVHLPKVLWEIGSNNLSMTEVILRFLLRLFQRKSCLVHQGVS